LLKRLPLPKSAPPRWQVLSRSGYLGIEKQRFPVTGDSAAAGHGANASPSAFPPSKRYNPATIRT